MAWRRLEKVPPGDEARLWLYGVARNVVRNSMRSTRRRARLSNRLSGSSDPPRPGPAETTMTRSEHADVLVALSKLRPGDQELLRLHAWEELSRSEIARVLDISISAVDMRLHRAIARLSVALDALAGDATSDATHVPKRRRTDVTRRIDPARADFVVSRLRASNPQKGDRQRMSPDQVESFILQVMERTEMIQDISSRRDMDEAPHPRARNMSPWLGFAVGFALAVLIAIPVLILTGGSTDPVADDPALQGLPAHQAGLASDVVGAINGEDFDDFRSLFAADGKVGFETGLHRPYHMGG